MTDIQAPPAPPVPPVTPATVPPTGGDRPPRRASARVIAILTICAGAAVIVGAAAGAVVSGIRSAATGTDTLTADAAGIAALDIDIDRADFEVVYDRVDQAELTVVGAVGDWRMVRDDDELSVHTDRSWFSGWFGGSGDRAVLTLPLSYADRTVDASLALAGGALRTTGAFGELDVDLAAGAIDVSGTADELDVDISAGRAAIDLADVAEGDVQVSAGELTGALTGTAPRALTIDVSAGRLDLTLPDEPYTVTSDVSAGGFDNRLETSATSSSRIAVSVSAGQVTLRPAD